MQCGIKNNRGDRNIPFKSSLPKRKYSHSQDLIKRADKALKKLKGMI
jgi:hypothetical protein